MSADTTFDRSREHDFQTGSARPRFDVLGRAASACNAVRGIRWTLVGARLKYWAWQVVTKLILGVIYIAVISEGLRVIVPALGQKLYKLPGLGALRDYEGTHRLDLAHFLAIFVLFAVFYLWDRILELWLESDEEFDDRGWNPEAHRRLVVVLGTVILGADACLFYVAMTQIGWRGTTFSFSALLATAAYLAVLIFVSFVSINLRKSITQLTKDD